MRYILGLLLFLALRNVYGDQAFENRYRRLVDLTRSNPVIHMNSEQFDTLVSNRQRNYTVLVLFTALSPQRQCAPCKEAYSELQILANSWRFTKQRTDDLFFSVIDFDHASEVFQTFNLTTAPCIMLVDPKSKLKQSDFLEIQRFGFMAEALSKWISSRTPIQIRIYRPPSYTGMLLLAAFMAVGLAALWFRRINLERLRNSSLWCMISLTIIFCGITGQMYNQIRGPPLLHGTPTGEVKALIYPGSDYQFVAETFIVMFLYIAATVGIVLIHQVDEIMDVGKRKIYLFGGVALFSVAFSLVLSVFRKKYQGYPYSFFFR